MKAMTRSELASAAGVSIQVFKKWYERLEPTILKRWPTQKRRGFLQPAVVRFLVDSLGIELTDENKTTTKVKK